MSDKNLVIIGAGPAGEAAASTASRKGGYNVILVEKEKAGGLCLNKGCIPSKTLLEHVHHLSLAQKPVNWEELQAVKNDVVTGLRTQLETRLSKEKVTTLHGVASFRDKNSLNVEISGKTEVVEFDKAILAAGTDIFYPIPLDSFRDSILNSDTMLNINNTPQNIVIVGGGAVGCEFACLLNAAGSHVTLVEMTDGLLPGEDSAVASLLAQIFEKRGITIKTGNTVKSMKKKSNDWELILSGGDTFQTEQILSCVGRTPSVKALSLDKAGIKVDKNRVVVNEKLQTSNPHVFAAGDVAGSRLAHHAADQGVTAALNALGDSKVCDDRFVPRCLYTWPEVASVGEWKYQREEKKLSVKATRAFFKGSSKALASHETDGFVQIISDPGSGKILGAQIIGAHATELIHIFSVALKAGMTTKDLSEVIFAHPTLSELIKEAARK